MTSFDTPEQAIKRTSNPNIPNMPDFWIGNPFFMVEKSFDKDPDFPTMMYRMGRNVSRKQAKQRLGREKIGKQVYEICVREKRQDPVECYDQKVAILREIIAALKE